MFLKLSGEGSFSYLSIAKTILNQAKKYRYDNNLFSWQQSILIPGGRITALSYGANDVVEISVDTDNLFITAVYGETTISYTIKEFFNLLGDKISPSKVTIIDDGLYSPVWEGVENEYVFNYYYSVQGGGKGFPSCNSGIDSKYINKYLVRLVFNQSVEFEIFEVIKYNLQSPLLALVSDWNPRGWFTTFNMSPASLGKYLSDGTYCLIPNLAYGDPSTNIWKSRLDDCSGYYTFTLDKYLLYKYIYKIKDKDNWSVTPIHQSISGFVPVGVLNTKCSSSGRVFVVKSLKDDVTFTDSSLNLSGIYRFYNKYTDGTSEYKRFNDEFKSYIQSKYIGNTDISLIKEFPNIIKIPIKINQSFDIEKSSYIQYTKSFDEQNLSLTYGYSLILDGKQVLSFSNLSAKKLVQDSTLQNYDNDKYYNGLYGINSGRYSFIKDKDLTIDLHAESNGFSFYLGRQFEYISSFDYDCGDNYYSILNKPNMQIGYFKVKTKIILYSAKWVLFVNGKAYDTGYKYNFAHYIPYISFDEFTSISGKNLVVNRGIASSFCKYFDGNGDWYIDGFTNNKQISRVFFSSGINYGLVSFDVYSVNDQTPRLVYLSSNYGLVWGYPNLQESQIPYVDSTYDAPIERKCFIFMNDGRLFSSFNLPKDSYNYRRLNGISLVELNKRVW